MIYGFRGHLAEQSGLEQKGPLGGAGLGKGGKPRTGSFLISSFSLPSSLPYFSPPLLNSWRLRENHNLWSHTALPQYVVGFGFFVKKNIFP
jgi:hypothetical protein